MSDKYIEYKGETYEQALEVLERHAITKLVDRDGVSYVASMIAMFEGVEHMQAERIAALEAENASLKQQLAEATFDVGQKEQARWIVETSLNELRAIAQEFSTAADRAAVDMGKAENEINGRQEYVAMQKLRRAIGHAYNAKVLTGEGEG